ncbi:MAG: glycosyltransferase family 4 protein [Candidatus Roizmanbacteria bacterium]|nr:glycosyltransferase family 4 protein [Candidatus Roizmanbacteria bacterium]
MKIGIYNPYLDSLSGGERYMLTIASCLSKQHGVSVFWDDSSIVKKAHERLAIDLKKVSVERNIFSRGIPLFKSLVATPHYDLIIVLSDGSIPFINSRYGILHFQRPFTGVGGSSLGNQLKLRKYQKVICNSQFTKKYIDREYRVLSEVVHPPVDINTLTSGKKENMILSVGRFHPFKKHEIMIQAFNKLNAQLKGWRLVIAGGLLPEDKSYYDDLNRMIKTNTVILLPNQSFSSLSKLYARAKIYWHAAGYGEKEHAHPENFEHFGITPVEAMAAQCIPVVYNGGGLPEIITDGENGFLWNTVDELIEYTRKIARNSPLGKKIISANKTYIEQFSQSNFCEEINRLVQSLRGSVS